MTFEFFPQPNIILQIGSISLYFYGAMYALSGIFSFFLFQFWTKRKNIEIENEKIIDLIFWTIFLGVIGGRLFYIFIYNYDLFMAGKISIYTVWKGGMSIHGGLIGGVIGFIGYCRYAKLPLGKLADIAVVPLALGMALGRLANFVNGELPGRITDVAWGMDFGDGENRHPSQLYAMGKDIVLFFIFSAILFRYNWKKPAGLLFASFLMLYSVFRFTVEFFRAPDPQLGFLFAGLSMGQLLSLLLFALGIGIGIILKKKF